MRLKEDALTTKTRSLDLSRLLFPAHKLRPGALTYCQKRQDHVIHTRIDNRFIMEAEPALFQGKDVVMDGKVVNTDRTVGARFSRQCIFF